MKKPSVVAILLGCSFVASLLLLTGGKASPEPGGETLWPTRGWTQATPASVGLNETALQALDKEIAGGKFYLIDSFTVFRCGKKVFERKYAHDYANIYGKQAKEKGPLNARLTGRYNYFDLEWHPYFHGSDLHTMQSVSKTVTSVIIGIARTRGDFKAGLDTPVLHYFDVAKVKNVDDRKRRITLRDVLTMTTGLEWNEQAVSYDDPRSDSSLMEATDDWVQYVIDKPMAEAPGKKFNYSSGATELLAYIFQKETGQDIDNYGQKYLFEPLGIQHHWKRTYSGVVDTEGGLYLNPDDLAKIGYLYLNDGKWEGKQRVSADWVKASLTPFIGVQPGLEYGYKWWLYDRKDSKELVWMALGFGGQRLMVFPDEQMIAVLTGWDILGEKREGEDIVARVLGAVQTKNCGGAGQ
jgi:CubicO group peptidase (beta-lactamase class C family)